MKARVAAVQYQLDGPWVLVRCLEPIPETLEALSELDPDDEDGTMLEELERTAARAQGIAPELGS